MGVSINKLLAFEDFPLHLARGLRYLQFKIFTCEHPIGAHPWSISTLPSLSPSPESSSYNDLGCVPCVHLAQGTWSPSLRSSPISPQSLVCGQFLGAPVLSLPYMRLLCLTDTVPQEAADPQAPPGPHFPIPSCGSSHTQGNTGHLAAYPRAAWLSYRARSQKPP